MFRSKLAKNIIECMLLLTITCLILAKVTDICQLNGKFYDEAEEVDVMFFGSSRMINGVYPMQLWKDYGITSYNLGAHANLLPATYWEMENAVEINEPKLIVLDTYGVSHNYKYETPEYLHKWMDEVPFGLTKIKSVIDLNDDKLKNEEIENGTVDGKFMGSTEEFLWNFIKYHSRWDELYDEDFNPPKLTEKGAEARIRVESYEDNRGINDGISISEEYVGEQYLRKFIESCQNRGIEVLLVYMPSVNKEDHYPQINRSEEIAKEYGLSFLNLFDNGLVDFQTDFYDEKHVNPLGAKKITDYVGQYIVDNYDIEDKRNDTSISEKWNDDYKKYVYYMSEVFVREEELKNTLLVTKFDVFDCIFEIYNPEVIHDELNSALLKKMNIDVSEAERVIAETNSCLIIVHGDGTPSSICSVEEVPEESRKNLKYGQTYLNVQKELFEPDCNIRITLTDTLNGGSYTKEF